MRQQMRTGIGFYLLILVIIAAAVYVSGTLDSGGQKSYNIVNFTQDLEDGNVTSVAILPNEEVPTGEVDVRKKDGSTQNFYVSDEHLVAVGIVDHTDRLGETILCHHVSRRCCRCLDILRSTCGDIVKDQ